MWEQLRDWAFTELREMRRAPVLGGLLLLVGFGAGWWVNGYFYAERFSIMQQRLAAAKEADANRADKPPAKQFKGALDYFRTWGGVDHRIGSRSGKGLHTTTPMPYGCNATVYTKELQSYRSQYKAVLVCQVSIKAVDSSTDTQLSVSMLYDLVEPELSMQTFFSKATLNVLYPSGGWVSYLFLLVPNGVDPKSATTVAALRKMGAVEVAAVGRGVHVPQMVEVHTPDEKSGQDGVTMYLTSAEYWKYVDHLCTKEPAMNCP